MRIDFTDDDFLKNELEKGNPQALRHFMNTYHHALCLYIYNLSNDYDGAKDIVQNVFLKVWENKDKAQSIKSIKNFLYRSAYNGFVDSLRKDKKMLPIEKKHLEALDRVIEVENGVSIEKQIVLVKNEIQKLPPKCKEVFLLSKQDGLTNMEIATYKNVSIRTVESHMNKAFGILRQQLKNKVEPLLFLLFNQDSADNHRDISKH